MPGTITKTNNQVDFVLGTQTILDSKGINSGQIYFTTDTNRLYWADPSDSGTLKWIDGVYRVKTLTNSPGSDIPEGTICVVNNSVNPERDGVYIANGAQWVPLDMEALTSTIATNGKTTSITIAPKHGTGISFNLEAGSNVNITSASNTITISVPTPTDTHLVANNNALSSTVTSGNLSIDLSAADSASHTISGNVTIVGGSNIHIQQDAVGGNIELSATDTQLSASKAAVSLTPASSTNGVKVVTAISDTASHAATGNFELVGADGISVSYNNNVITLTGGTEGVIGNIQDYVDQALANALGDLDAMKFKGAISVADFNNLNPSTFESGWAYKFTTSGTVTGASADVDIGDMVIMSQDTSNNWIYNIIPSGDDTDVYYTPSNDATNHQVKFTDNTGTLTVAHKIIGANGITTTASVNGKTLTETIKHVTITPTSMTAKVTNNFVSAMIFDDYGHPSTVTYAPAHVAVTPTASSSTVNTFINGLTFDTYGHVTAYTSATVDIDTNMYWHTLS